MTDVMQFKEVKQLLWDSVNTIILHEGTDTEYELNLKNANPELKLLRAIFNSEDLDALPVDGIMTDEFGFALSVPYTPTTFTAISELAKRYGLRIKKTTFM